MIENLIERLIASLDANTAAHERSADALRGASSAVAAKPKAAAAKEDEPAKEEAPARKPKAEASEKPKAEKPAAEKPAAGRRAKALTLDDVKAEFGKYLDPSHIKDEDDYEAEKEARTDKVVAIFEEFGVNKITKLDPADYPRALKLLNEVIEKGKANFAGDEDADEDDDPLG